MAISLSRTLSEAELDTVSGGQGYKYCSNGPDGEGLYVATADCRTATQKYIDAILEGVEQGKGKGKGKPPT